MDTKNIEAIYPLSPAQEDALADADAARGPASHPRQLRCSLEGRLDVTALERAWREVAESRRVLRTTFVWRRVENPVQVVHKSSAPPFEYEDWRALSPAEQEARLGALVLEERGRGFDPAEAPPTRLCLRRAADELHHLVWTYHDLMLDDRSAFLILDQLAAAYGKLPEGAGPAAGQLTYKDYISWLKSQDTSGSKEYWARALEGFDAPAPLFGGRGAGRAADAAPAPLTLTSRPAGATAEALQLLAREYGLDAETVLQGAWALLLGRYSGERDVTFGVTLDGRPRGLEEFESAAGPFARTLPLKVCVDERAAAATWLRGLQAARAELSRHQFVSLARIREWAGIPHDQTLFESRVVAGAGQPPVSRIETGRGGLTIDGIDFIEPAREAAALLHSPAGAEFVLRIAYDGARLDEAAAARLLGHLECLIQGMAARPGSPLSELPLMNQGELRQLLVEWNDTATDYPAECVQSLFERQVEATPDAPAIEFEQERVTYAELNRRANQLAHHLRHLGVGPEVPVGICVERSVEMIVGLLGILKAGGAYVPLDASLPAERLSFMVDDTDVPVLLTQERLADRLPAVWAQLVMLDADREAIARQSDENPPAATTPDNLAYIMYTSGSTGRPKGVCVTHRGVVRLVRETDYVSFGPDETVLQFAPLSFDASTFEIWGALLNGCRLAVFPAHTPSLPELGQALKRHGVTTLWLTAGLFHLMADHQGEELRGLRQLLAGGDVLSAPRAERVSRELTRGRLINGYGPTESTTFACCYTVPQDAPLGDSVPIGRPIANTQVYILDAGLRPVPAGVGGELHVGGAGLARGYLRRPGLTAERFIPDPFGGGPGARLYRTGDLARYLPDGRIEFLGRADRQVKVRGFRVETEEVEVVLGQHPSVREVAVVAREDGAGKRLVAYVVPAAGAAAAATTAEVQEYLKERLPDYMIPGAVVALDGLPLTRNGKVDRAALAELEPTLPPAEEAAELPQDTVEEVLAAIWSQVLGVEQVGAHDNFFALGGDSIRSIQVASLAEKRGLNLPVEKIFEFQTIRELAKEISAEEAAVVAAVESSPLSLVSEQDRAKLPPDVEDAYPLTMLQAGMVFHSELSPESGLYHDILGFHLQAPLNVEAMRAVAQQLAARHAILRTSIDQVSYGEPLQLVHREARIPVAVEDLRHLAPAEQEAALAGWMDAEKGRGFDWAQAPLLRLQVHRRTDQTFQFAVSFHHAILDGWSLSSLLTELFNRYTSLLGEGAVRAEQPLEVSFRDFVALERRTLASEEAKRYWAGRLAGGEPTLMPRWPSAWREPAAAAGENFTVDVDIPPGVLDGLRRLARAAAVPFKSVLVAAHLRVLSLVSGQSDVVTGVVSHGRLPSPDAAEVLGLFLNALPFRMKLGGGTWQELAQEAFAVEQEGMPFRWYPMAQIQKDLGGAVLYETAFTFTRFHVLKSLEKVAGVELLGTVEFARANIPFAPFFREDPSSSRLDLHLDYDPAELSAAQVESVAQYYAATLAAMARDPAGRYESECLLPDAERGRRLEWNDTKGDSAAALSAHGLFEMQAARTPEATALRFEDEELTFRELNEKANQVAHHLRSLGVGPEVVVGLSVEPSAEMLIGLLGILKAGGAFVPLDPSYPLGRLAFMLKDTQTPVLVTQEKFIDELPAHWGQAVSLDGDWDAISRQSTANPAAVVDGDNLAYVIYTSGSTGEPKGVQATHRALVNDAAAMINLSGLDAGHRLLQFVPLSFDAAIQQIFMTLGCGASLVVARDVTDVPPRELLEKCERWGVTTLYLPPAYWHQMVLDLAAARAPVPGWLRLLLVGGESPLAERLAEWARMGEYKSGFVNAYGPAEATVTATFYKAPMEPGALDMLTRVPVGRPIANVRTHVLDRHMQPAPVGTPGELYIGGAGLTRGYLRRPGLTAERFIPDPFGGGPGARLYRTGDLARFLPDGHIEFLGRVDQQVKVRGFRIELGEIEAVLRLHPQVREVVVVAHEGAPGEKSLAAYVVSADAAGPAGAELRNFLRDQLPAYMIPSTFVALDAIPLTANGKVDYRELAKAGEAAPELDGSAAAAAAAPRTPAQEVLAGIWEQILEVPTVGVDQNFFDLGGHSLLATQVFSRVREAFQVELPLRALFESPTVAGLATAIEAARLESRGLQSPPINPAPRDAALPLSFAQQRLWFLDQLRPGNPFYNVPAALRLRGDLDAAALEQSFAEIVRRHETLRTVFTVADGAPVQVVLPAGPFTLTVVDLSGLPDEVREAEAARLAAEEAQLPFDLGRGPLLRASLLRPSGREHVLLLTMHHIISDGWSVGVLTREVVALYKAYAAGQPSQLPELPVQYADVAVWQREWLRGEVLEAQLSYWRQQLGGAPQVLELHADRARPPVQSFRGARRTLTLSAEVRQALKGLSRQEGVTLFMVLLGAFDVLLHRYSGQSDIVVGTDIANRNRAETEGLIGFFVNQLVLRVDLSGDPTFRQLLGRVRRVTLDAYAHQDVGFERLVEILQPERNLSYTPLFQVKFVYQNAPAPEVELPGLNLSFMGGESGVSRYDLILTMEEMGGELVGLLEYSTDLFDDATIDRLIGHFQTLLRNVASDPDTKVSALRLLTDAEERRLLVEWNATEVAFDDDKCIHQLFEARASVGGDHAALITEGGETSYRELNERANQLAHHLRSLGVGAEVRVGVCLERSPEMLVAIFGVLKAGGAYVPLDPSYPLERLAFMLEDAQTPIVITVEDLIDKLPAYQAQLVCLDADGEVIAGHGRENPPPVTTPESLAYVIYTSGTTGVPKGVMVQHRGVCNLAKWQADNFRITERSRVAQFFSYSFDGAVGETFMALLNGATLVMLGSDNLEPRQLIGSINHYGITVAVFVPSVIRELDPGLLERPETLSVVSVGEACPPGLAALWSEHCDFMNAYGPTEYTVYSHLWRVDVAALGSRRSVPIGTPIHNTKTYILDPQHLNPVPVGVVGEICISGAGLARGYLNRPEVSAEKFIPNHLARAEAFDDMGAVRVESAGAEIARFKKEHAGAGRVRAAATNGGRPPIDLEPEQILRLVEGLDADLVERTRTFVGEYGDDRAAYEGFCRYLLEGADGNFSSCGINEEVLRFVLPYEDFRGLKGIEFCFGNGEVMEMLARAGAGMTGIDLSPFFVQRARDRQLDALMAKADVAPGDFAAASGVVPGSYDFALCVLALDRVENPRNLLANLFSSLKDGGRFSVHTLLPIVPVDDGDVENPITYTPEENRITPGESAEGDRAALAGLLSALGAAGTRVCRLPYVVASGDGTQSYEVWSFFGAKEAARASAPAGESYARLYRTGDLGRYLPDGTIEFVGRVDQQVKLRGFRIEPGEIEAVLERLPSIAAAAVAMREDHPGEKRLAAYVVATGPQPPSVAELRRALGEKLPDYMLPSAFVFLDALPLSANGKVDLDALPSPDGSRPELGEAIVAPETDVERAIAEIWQQVLKLDRVGVNDNFFDLGGHSLLMIEVSTRLREVFGREVSITDLFQYPTISSLSKYVGEGQNEQPSYQQTQERAKKETEGVNRRRQELKKRLGK